MPACGYPVAKKAREKEKQRQTRTGCLGCLGILGVLIVIGGIASIFGHGADSQKSSPLIASGDGVISGDSYFGCTDRATYQKIVGYVAEKDSDAFKEALGDALLTGGCRMFQRGEPVFISEKPGYSPASLRCAGRTTLRNTGSRWKPSGIERRLGIDPPRRFQDAANFILSRGG